MLVLICTELAAWVLKPMRVFPFAHHGDVSRQRKIFHAARLVLVFYFLFVIVLMLVVVLVRRLQWLLRTLGYALASLKSRLMSFLCTLMVRLGDKGQEDDARLLEDVSGPLICNRCAVQSWGSEPDSQ